MIAFANGGSTMAKFHIYRDKKGEFRWRLIAQNGNMIANGGEGYTTKTNFKKGIASVIKNSPTDEIVED